MIKLKPEETDYKVRVKRVFDATERCLEVVERLGLVEKKKAMFRRRFQVSIKSGDGAFGGCKNGIPYIKISTHCRDHNKQQWLEYLIEKDWTSPKIWREAVIAAKDNKWMFVEYSSFHKDPEIGGFLSDDPLDHVRATVAHEIAHAIHWWHIEMCGHKKSSPHGSDWRVLYRALRREWVNPLINKGNDNG